MKVVFRKQRLAFANIYTPTAFEGGAQKSFNMKLVIDPKDPIVAELDKAILAVAKDKWGPKAQQILDNMTKTGKKPDVPFVKEPYKNRDGDVYDGFEGKYYLTASAKETAPPLVVDRGKHEVKQGFPEAPYSGCYVNGSVELWAQDNSFGRAIRCQVKLVQFAGDGEAFGGGAPPNLDDLDDLTVEEEDALA